MKKMHRRGSGFTLVQLIVVIAVIVILAAIAIPSITGYIDDAKRAACVSNRRSLKIELISENLLDGLDGAAIGAISLSANNSYTYNGCKYTCPSGGEIYAVFADGEIDVRCKYHESDPTGDVSVPVWTNSAADKIWGIVKGYPVGIDSEAVSGANRNALLKSLSDAKIDISDMKMTSWRYGSDGFGTFFQWTTADISKLNPGDPITIIRYRLDNQYEGVYSVWKGKVSVNNKGVNTVEAVGGGINDEYTSKLSMEEKKNIQNVLPYYNDNAQGFDPLP